MGLKNSSPEKQENNKFDYQNLTDHDANMYETDQIFNKEDKSEVKAYDFDADVKKKIILFFNNVFIVINIIKNAISFKNSKKKLEREETNSSEHNILNSKIIIIFIWLIWITNVAIFTNKDLIDLFFPDMASIKYMLLLCSLFILFETSNIINGGYYRFHNIIFYIYFAILLIISFKSLLYNKQGWQFYLIIIVINLNLKILNLNN